MIYFPSWRGKGFIALLAIFVAIAFFLAGSAFFGEDAGLFSFAVGWVVAGVLCFFLGVKWNRIADVHRFCLLRLQTWGIIYALIGLFFLRVGWTDLSAQRANHHSLSGQR